MTNKTVRLFFALTATMVIMCSICMGLYARQEVNKAFSHVYPKCGVVVEVAHDSDEVSVQDFNSNVWVFEGAEDWMVGDIASMLMDDNGTENIYDDIIMDVHYEGWVEE